MLVGYAGPEGWPAMPPGYPPPGYDYYSGYYYPPYGAYPPGYDYSGYYDYSAYYSQPPADWSSYAAAAASYAPPYTGTLHRWLLVLNLLDCCTHCDCLENLELSGNLTFAGNVKNCPKVKKSGKMLSRKKNFMFGTSLVFSSIIEETEW